MRKLLSDICESIHIKALSEPGTIIERFAPSICRNFKVSVGDIFKVRSSDGVCLELETQTEGINMVQKGWDASFFKKVVEK